MGPPRAPRPRSGGRIADRGHRRLSPRIHERSANRYARVCVWWWVGARQARRMAAAAGAAAARQTRRAATARRQDEARGAKPARASFRCPCSFCLRSDLFRWRPLSPPPQSSLDSEVESLASSLALRCSAVERARRPLQVRSSPLCACPTLSSCTLECSIIMSHFARDLDALTRFCFSINSFSCLPDALVPRAADSISGAQI